MKFIGLVLTALLPLVPCLAGEKEYLTSHVSGDSGWGIIFPAEFPQEKYVDFHLALDVVELECDGVKIQPKLGDAAVHFNYATYPASDERVLYTCRYYELWTAVKEGSRFTTGKILVYDLPKEARRIKVRYRVRTPSGETSEVFSVVSCDRAVLPLQR